MTEATILALVAIVGTVITALFKLLNDNTKALTALVEESRKGNVEAAKRNGHLGDQNIKITELIVNHEKDVHALVGEAVTKVIETVQNVKVQNVEQQHVETTTE